MTISVALCTYNGAAFLEKQLASIMDQSHKVDEIVACDDRSTDNTLEILERFRSENQEISWKIIVNSENLGSNKNFEKATGLCTGQILFLSDQDDIWEKEKVEKHVAFYNNNPGHWACFSNGALVSDDGVLMDGGLWESHGFSPAMISNDYNKLYEYQLLCSNIVTGATLSIRKEALPYLYPFEKTSQEVHDAHIGLVVSYFNRLGFIPAKLVQYRLHATQQIGVPLHEMGYADSARKLLIWERRFPELKADKMLWHFQRAHQLHNMMRSLFTPREQEIDFTVEFSTIRRQFLKKFPAWKRMMIMLRWWKSNLFMVRLKDILRNNPA